MDMRRPGIGGGGLAMPGSGSSGGAPPGHMGVPAGGRPGGSAGLGGRGVGGGMGGMGMGGPAPGGHPAGIGGMGGMRGMGGPVPGGRGGSLPLSPPLAVSGPMSGGSYPGVMGGSMPLGAGSGVTAGGAPRSPPMPSAGGPPVHSGVPGLAGMGGGLAGAAEPFGAGGGGNIMSMMHKGPGGLPGREGTTASFDMATDFPSLPSSATGVGELSGATAGGRPGYLSMSGARSEFVVHNEHFPALPGSGGVGEGGVGSSFEGSVSAVGSSALSQAAATVATSESYSGGTAPATSASGSGVPGGDSRTPPASPHITPLSEAAAGSTAAQGGAGGAEQFGLMGLLGVIRMTDRDLNMLALGTDLTTLGLNLNSSDVLYGSFSSPFADNPTASRGEPQFSLPQCYYMQPPALKTGHLGKFLLETLFYIFYAMPRDILQAYAAQELYNRDWRYHKDLKLWFHRHTEALRGVKPSPHQFIVFDTASWEKRVYEFPAGQNAASVAAGFLSPEDAKVKFSS